MPTTGQDTTSDPPPSSVIVTEYAGASAQGGSGTGQADDGWGDTSGGGGQSSGSSSGSSPGYASSSGTHYEVKDGSSGSITVTSGTLSASTPKNTTPDANGNFSALGASVSVGLNVAGVNATITLDGATPDPSGRQNILVGQGCKASLSGIPAGWTDPSYNPSYSWSAEGNKFQSWTVTAGVDASGNPTSSAVLNGGMGTTTDPTAHWFWSDKAGSKTITCKASFTPPAVQGSPPPPAVSFTVTQKVQLRIPDYSATPMAGRVQINNSYPGQSGYWLYAGAGKFGPSRGMEWKVKVPTPSLFASQTGGGWWFDQLVTPGRWRTPFGGSEKSWPINGPEGLDKGHPYPAPLGSQNPPVGMPVGSFALSGSEITSGDSPGLPIDNDFSSYRIQEKFRTYVMYVPPGGDVQPVPLHEIDWNWKTTPEQIQKPDGGWSNWPDDTQDAGDVAITSSNGQTKHPQWTLLVIPPTSW